MDARPLPDRPSLAQVEQDAKALLAACKSGDDGALYEWATRWIAAWAVEWRKTQARLDGVTVIPRVRERIVQEVKRIEAGVRANRPTQLAEARRLIARGYGFASWLKFAKHIHGMNRKRSPVARFEAAVDAVITGDVATLARLLRATPGLVRARSLRTHRATLLYYVGANGVEDFRQQTPKNIVEIAKRLLAAGAAVDARAGARSQDTALGAVATSVHPVRAGVQRALMETLLAAGAAVDGVPGGWPIVNGCLANGRGEAAEFLATRGARLDLEGAAGVGRLVLVRTFFDARGRLRKATATKAQLAAGFDWACEYGRTAVVELLLPRVDPAAFVSGFHWAVVGGRLDTLRLFLDRRASLEVRSHWGGTPLGTAVWCAEHNETDADYVPVIRALIAAGANVDADPRLKERVAAVLRAARGS